MITLVEFPVIAAVGFDQRMMLKRIPVGKLSLEAADNFMSGFIQILAWADNIQVREGKYADGCARINFGKIL